MTDVHEGTQHQPSPEPGLICHETVWVPLLSLAALAGAAGCASASQPSSELTGTTTAAPSVTAASSSISTASPPTGTASASASAGAPSKPAGPTEVTADQLSPPCPAAQGMPPVGIIRIDDNRHGRSEISRLQLATKSKALSPSLLAFQQRIDDWLDKRLREAAQIPKSECAHLPGCGAISASCEVQRNDGEFISVVCSSGPLMGSARLVGSTSFTVRRVGERLEMMTPQSLLPKLPDPVASWTKRCPEAGGSPEDTEGVERWSLQGDYLRIKFPAYHPSGGNCWLPLYSLHQDHGSCSSLMRPHPTIAGATGKPALAFALGRRDPFNQYSSLLKVWSDYPSRKKAVAAIQAKLDTLYQQMLHSGQEYIGGSCSVGWSTASVFSAMCHGDAKNEQGWTAINLSYRLDKAAPIAVDEVLAGRRDAVSFITKRCLSKALNAGPDERRLKALPKLQPKDLAIFSLGQKSVTFLLGIQFEGLPKPVTEWCSVRYKDLNLIASRFTR